MALTKLSLELFISQAVYSVADDAIQLKFPLLVTGNFKWQLNVCVCVRLCLRHMSVNLLGIILNMEPLGVARCQNLIFVNIFILSGGSLCHLFNSFIDSIVTGARHVPADRLPAARATKRPSQPATL